MSLLFDTHVVLWFISGDPRLSSTVRSLLESSHEARLFSIASLWEIAIKVSLARLELPTPHGPFLRQMLADLEIELLAIKPEHPEIVATLPYHHRDPFDRLLIAQAISDGLTIVSQDPQLAKYGVTVIS